MKKRMGCLAVFLAMSAFGLFSTWQVGREEEARRAALSPAERAKEDRVKREQIAQSRQESVDRELIAAAQARVRDRLKDPESARFGAAFVRSNIVCGYVNSKNSFGGYGGDELFYGMGSLMYFDNDLKEMTKEEQKLPREMRAKCEGK